MSKQLLTVIIISYNSAKVLEQNLRGVIDDDQFDIIIVDNASCDKSDDSIRMRFPNVKLIGLKQNVGYGRAANVAIKSLNSPYALLLNPDLSTSTKDILKFLQLAQGYTNTAIWAPATKLADSQDCEPKCVEWVSGCAMLLDVKKIIEVGLFDENIFLFFEETDLCKRVIEKGYSIKFCRNIFFNHQSGIACEQSANITWLKNWHYGWSRCYYYSKHKPNSPKHSATRQFRQYRRKWLTSLTKRAKYKAQAAGAKAFINGQKAFNLDGSANS